MQGRLPLAEAAWCVTLALTLVCACGGHSSRNRDQASDAGSGGASSLAGSSNGGGSKPQAGTSGSAGTPSGDDACSGPSELGTCAAAFQRWTHDSSTGVCLAVGYGGCGATKNNYETLAACQAACPGGSPNFDACQVASDCMLADRGCCGVCDGPGISKHDFIAYNKVNAGRVPTCPSNVACGACPNPDPGEMTRQNFIANCVQGECVVEDIRESDLSACASDEDCRMRGGTGCCESCGTYDAVAVRNDGSLEELVCGGELPPCPACDPAMALDAVPVCIESGHCRLSIPAR